MKHDLAYLLISTQRALLGMVSPSLRAVIVDLDEEKEHLILYFYFDGKITDTLLDDAQCISMETSASFPVGYTCEENFLRIDAPKKIPYKSGIYAYRRKEKNYAEI